MSVAMFCYFLLCFQLLFTNTIARSFTLRPSAEQDGSKELSIFTTSTCSCSSVEVWLKKRSSQSNVELASYQDETRNEPHSSCRTVKRLRVWPQKHCELQNDVLKTDDCNQTKIAIVQGSVEITLLTNVSNCASFWVKCKQKLFCVGIDVDANDIVPATRRKLLMVSGGHEELLSFHKYGVIFSGLVICAMVILVALCGSAPRKSPSGEVYTGEGDIKVISSEKIQTMPRKSDDDSGVETKQKDVEHNTAICDANLNTSPNVIENHGAANIVDNYEPVVHDESDGQVFEKESEKSRKKQEAKSKKKSKRKGEAALPRANTSPDCVRQDEEQKAKFSSKLKSFSSAKKEKKETRPSSENDDTEHTLTACKAQVTTEKRRSFVCRELPQLPGGGMSNDDNYAQRFDRKESKPMSQTDIEEDTNYECVSNAVRTGRIVSAKDEVRNSHQFHTDVEGTEDRHTDVFVSPAGVGRTDEPQLDMYDVVTDTKNTLVSCDMAAGSATFADTAAAMTDEAQPDTYEDVRIEGTFASRNVTTGSVTTGTTAAMIDDLKTDTYDQVILESSKNTSPQPPEAQVDFLYEAVDNNGGSSALYDMPQDRRVRSASDRTVETTKLESPGRKTSSLPREKVLGPTPPPLDHLRAAAANRQLSEENDELSQHIEPYTVATKKGDYIIQETSLPALPILRSKIHHETKPLSPEEIDVLYSKVDKEKQKKDREEMKQTQRSGASEDGAESEDDNYERLVDNSSQKDGNDNVS